MTQMMQIHTPGTNILTTPQSADRLAGPLQKSTLVYALFALHRRDRTHPVNSGTGRNSPRGNTRFRLSMCTPPIAGRPLLGR